MPLQEQIDDSIDLSRIQTAVKSYQGHSLDPHEEIITDILADLMHLCASIDMDFEHCLDHGRRHYYDEIRHT